MKDNEKTNEQLESELSEMRSRVSELEKSERELKRVDEELRRINNIQSLILNNNIMGIAFVRNRIFEWVNQRIPEMLGMPLERIKGAGTRIIYSSDEEYEATGRAAYTAMNRGEWFEYHINVPRADGTSFIGRIVGKSLNPYFPQEGSVWIFEDISRRKDAEKETRDMLNFLQSLIETIPSPIFYKDTKGIYRGCNKAFADFLGLKREDIVGKSVYDIYPKDLADKYYEMDSSARWRKYSWPKESASARSWTARPSRPLSSTATSW